MNLFTGLLFQQGHILNTDLALSLANQEADAEARPASADAGAGTPRRESPCLAFKRGAIAAICSATALSPFR
ncbi:hypothetical protein [Luteimonas aquatica]|uniref:hypothetical protein n=1 Tax=Luteimonas aquatica TaxID=450364 RepID=UPI001F586CEC|nr:hypothetical protein [Luteimonas aquatica]